MTLLLVQILKTRTPPPPNFKGGGNCKSIKSKETKLGNSNQEVSPSAGKSTGVVLVPWHAWKCVPTTISGGVDISEVPGCHLLQQVSSQ